MTIKVSDLRHYVWFIISHCLVISHTHLKPSHIVAYVGTWICWACDLSPAQDKKGSAAIMAMPYLRGFQPVANQK